VHILVLLVHILAVFSAYLYAYFTLFKCITILSLVITVMVCYVTKGFYNFFSIFLVRIDLL